MNNFLKKKKILLIVTGGIACYKSLDLIRRLQDCGVDVECILTKSAIEFVNKITFESLLGKKVHSNLFSLNEEKKMSHIYLANEMDMIIIAPCTANFLAKMASGTADDLALNVLLASNGYKVVAPAMNTKMWNNPAVKKNKKNLLEMDIIFLEPDSGKLACGTEGSGKLMEVEKIVENINQIFTPKSLSGLKAIVTAGPSIEEIDPVRFISNFSSGRQGYEIAKALKNAGANTTLISGPTNLKETLGVHKINVMSGIDFYNEAVKNLPCDIFISVAAISDWKSSNIKNKKIKKNEASLSLKLIKNIDVLDRISKSKFRPSLVVGFSAETNDLIKNSKAKLKKKNCDWIIANIISNSKGFGNVKNKIIFLEKSKIENWPYLNKEQISKKIVKKIVNFFKKK